MRVRLMPFSMLLPFPVWLSMSLWMLAPDRASAQGTLPLSMKRAVEIALAPDGSTRAALALESIQQAEQRVTQAKASFLPSLDASVQDRRQTVNLRAYGFTFNLPVPGFSIPSIV